MFMYPIIIISFRKIFTSLLSYARKKQTEGVEDMEFPGALKK